jgi:hypothetical protein
VPSSAASMASRMVFTRSRASSSDSSTILQLYQYDTPQSDIPHAVAETDKPPRSAPNNADLAWSLDACLRRPPSARLTWKVLK